jgi:predicted O-linked N-acetylglucosamine transferase (SPINDLY family)
MTPITIDQAIQTAIAHHQAGRLAEAEAIYRRILGQDPARPDALHLLGAIACQTGHPSAAIDLIGRAIRFAPRVAAYHNDLAEAFHQAGRLTEAIASLGQAIELDPNLALAHINLGNIFRAAGRPDEAAAAYRRAIALAPGDAQVHNNLGVALHAAGRSDEAVAAYRGAIALAPGAARMHSNLGVALHATGRSDEAIAAYKRALELDATDPRTYSNLGMTLLETGRPDAALVPLGRAVALDPNLAEAHNNLGSALRAAGRLDEAIASLRRAVELDPARAEAHDNLASVLREQGRLDEALASFRRAVTLRPDDAKVGSNLLFTLHSHPDFDGPALLAEHRRWAQRHADPLAALIEPHTNDRAPDRTLRVGYVSPDFRAHAVGQMVLSLFANHDRRQVEVIAYSDVQTPDVLTGKLKVRADRWVDTAGLSDAQLADRIRSDRIDILVDLALHTAGNRMLVFARKPAPVQVTMLGLPATTGLATMDYRLTDPYLDPVDTADLHYIEHSLRLPHCFWIFPPPDEAPPVGPLPAQRNGFVTFGCLNQPIKVTRPVLELWRTILQALPGSRLVLQSPHGSHQGAIRALFEQAGIAGGRVEFVPRTGRNAYFRRYLDLDLALDPFPYNGHTSTLDALWMGVPVVTLAGRTAVGRGGVSILSNLGLTELIARSPEHYVEIARSWADDSARLAALRGGLRQQMLASPLTDGKQYARDVEAAFRTVWHGWSSSRGRTVAGNPEAAEFHARLGIALHGKGQREEAIAAYRRALALGSEDSRVHSNLGVALQEIGRADEALAAFDRSIALKDDDASVHCNRGATLLEAGRFEEAIAACHRAIALEPGHAEAHYNLGCAWRLEGDSDRAIAALSRAIELKPDHALAHNNLGITFHARGSADLAIAALHRAIELRPDFAEAHNNLGNVLKDQGRLDDALAELRTALRLKPEFARAASNLLITLHFHHELDAQKILAEHRRWARRYAEPLAAEIRPHANDRASDRRLRVGFLSPDLRDHPVGQSLLPLFQYRDCRQFAVVGYSDVPAPDRLTDQLRAAADEWHETVRLGDAELAERIRADRIDILVDTTLHTAHNRMLVFARKPAPVLVTMLGPPVTTGLVTMDYRLTDPYLDPPGTSDADYTERSIRLPHCFWIFHPPEPAPPVSALPALRKGFVTFGCLNQLAKVTPPALELWRTILQAVPGSRLVLQSPRGSHLDAIRAHFAAGGIAADRLEFVMRTARGAYLERFQDLDLCLDPFPFNGHTSTFDALWMGVPVITLAGRTAVGRGGASILSNAGLPELVARTPEEYVMIAVAWARNLARLAEVRAGLRGRIRTSVLVDGRQYAGDVAAAFRGMWRTAVEKNAEFAL